MNGRYEAIRPRVFFAALLCAVIAAQFAGGDAALAQQEEDSDAPFGQDLHTLYVPLTDAVRQKLDAMAADLRKTPDDASKLAQYGLALTKAGRLDDGLAALTRAGTLAPNDPKVQLAVARGLWKARHDDEAATAALKVINSPLTPPKDAAEACRLVGYIRFSQGNLTEAETVLRDGLRRDPKNGPLLLTLGGVLRMDKARVPEALFLIDQAVAAAPKDARLLQRVALMMQGMGRLDRAKVLWEQIADLRPDDPNAAFIAAQHEYRTEEYAKVISRLERALKVSTSDASGRLLYAKALLRVGRFEDARRAAQMADKLGAVGAKEALAAIDLEQGQAGK